jgi:hypothetical protein
MCRRSSAGRSSKGEIRRDGDGEGGGEEALGAADMFVGLLTGC